MTTEVPSRANPGLTPGAVALPVRAGFAVPETDVFVMGGGPAGLAAAIAARRKGFRVTVADCALPPIDKVCGEGLMPDGVLALAELGVRVEGHHFRGIRFLDTGREACATFPAGDGLGIRRTTLHQRMIETAEEAGVELWWGARISPEAVRCRWIIGADGENSRVRRWAGLDANVRYMRRFGFRRHFAVEPWTGFVEVHWDDGCQLYVTPVTSEEVGIVAISNNHHCRFDEVLRRFPSVAQRLRGKEATTAERGAVTSSRKLESVYRGRAALVGDASGSVDAITGEGLSLAFRQAIALAEALERGDLAPYQAEHRRIARRPAFMGALMLAMAEHTWFRRAAMGAMVLHPGILSRMLAFHVGVAHDFTERTSVRTA
jgi:flavin-dependent dehydrogenase